MFRKLSYTTFLQKPLSPAVNRKQGWFVIGLLILLLIFLHTVHTLPTHAAATWDDITPSNPEPWSSGSLLGELNGKYYVSLRYQDGGNRYLLYELSDGNLTEVTPSGTWSSILAPVVLDNKGYFVFRDGLTNTQHIYELDNGTWTDVTPGEPGDTWDQGGSGISFDSKGYFLLRNSTTQEYHLWQSDNGSWSDITASYTEPWTSGSLLGELNGKYYVSFRYNDSGNRYLLYELSGGSLTEVTPSGTWSSILAPVVLGNKGYFVLRDGIAMTQHVYELDGGSWTDVTPGELSDSWDQGGSGITFESKGYFLFRHDVTEEYHLWEYDNGIWSDITPSYTEPWTSGSLLGELNGKYYVSMRYNDGGNRYLLYELSGGNLTEVTPTGEWMSILAPIDLGGNGYFVLRDGVAMTQHVYELDGSTWTDVTPGDPGDSWDQGGSGEVFDSMGYFLLRDTTSQEYHVLELTPDPGSLTIVLESDPEDDTSFSFNGDNGLGNFSLTDPSDNTETFAAITYGTYVITETVPAGWTLDSATCTGGSYSGVAHGVSVTVNSNDDVTCTFNNQKEPAGNLTIVLEADPEDDTSFSFSGDNGLGNFSLTDPSDNTESFDGITPGTYTVTEAVPAGWTLNDTTCTGGSYSGISNGVSVTVVNGSNIICTFSNEKDETGPNPAGNLTVILESIPADNTNFSFMGDNGLGNFALSDPSDNTELFVDITPGTYTVTENVPTGWTLVSASCTGGSYSGVTNGLAVAVMDGADVTCTFSNQQDLFEKTWYTYLPYLVR